MPKDKNKPRGRMTAYAFFVQTCREEHKKKHPGENVVFAEFSKKCAEKWKLMGAKEKKRFEDMAAKDKVRYEKEMAHYTPDEGAKGGKKRKHKKDPNAPKRALSAFFFFCNEQRASVREANPSYGIGDIAKELAKRWEAVKSKTKYEEMAKKDKARYEKEMAAYKKSGGGGGSSPAKKSKPAAKKKAAPPPPEDDDEEDDDEDDEEEDDDEEDEEDDE